MDSHNYPNLPLMKISAWHKSQGDNVEFALPLKRCDKIYISKIFGEEYSSMDTFCYQADEIVCGGTGFAITVENGREVYHKELDKPLPDELEHIYPDYSLYPEYTEDKAIGFLTRGCCNNCGFCLVSKKEGLCSKKVADLSEFWRGQKYIDLLDANILACRDRIELLKQLAESEAQVNFYQGLDARFMTDEVAEVLKRIKIRLVHFAFDEMKNEERLLKGLEVYRRAFPNERQKAIVYILTNYNTTIEEDLYRVRKVQELGLLPDVRIYRKPTAPQVVKDLQGWCSNRRIYRSCDFMDYKPGRKACGDKTVKELYFYKKED